MRLKLCRLVSILLNRGSAPVSLVLALIILLNSDESGPAHLFAGVLCFHVGFRASKNITKYLSHDGTKEQK